MKINDIYAEAKCKAGKLQQARDKIYQRVAQHGPTIKKAVELGQNGMAHYRRVKDLSPAAAGLALITESASALLDAATKGGSGEWVQVKLPAFAAAEFVSAAKALGKPIPFKGTAALLVPYDVENHALLTARSDRELSYYPQSVRDAQHVIELLRDRAIASFPPVVTYRVIDKEGGGGEPEVVPHKITAMRSPVGDEHFKTIVKYWEYSAANQDRFKIRKTHIFGGKPGVGKTCMVGQIAMDFLTWRGGKGRILWLTADSFDQGNPVTVAETLRPTVTVIDELDKISDNVQHKLEMIVAASDLVLLTANNHENDNVLDGALVRPGRIDRSYTIKDIGVAREVEPWVAELPEDVMEYYIACENAAIREEIRFRWEVDQCVDIDDIRQRAEMKCRSAGKLRR